MYLIEFEESQREGQKQTVVRILDPTADTEAAKLIAETVYQGSPPGLCFQTGTTFALLRVPSAHQE